MSRNCLTCGTLFNESIDDIALGVIDKIPECWKKGKESGYCINCCKCKHKK